MANTNIDVCDCGVVLPYQISSTVTPKKRVCQCGRVHYVEDPHIDWWKIKKANAKVIPCYS